jgi:sugar/nucleoside kinase (ribokinase family)
MSRTRHEICEAASRQLSAAAPSLPRINALIGLDGFVDEIIAVVDKRLNNEVFERVKTIDDLARKIDGAAGQSSNYELVVKQMKLGGNGPIMANALASAGMNVTYVGNLGYPNLHAVFEPFSKRATVISIAEPGHTDALEFDDGKLMLGKLMPLNDVNWPNIVDRVGRDKIQGLVEGSRLIGMVNWTMLPHMSRIWASLQDEVMSKLPTASSGGKDRKLFVDLADPEKRTHQDIAEAMHILGRFQKSADVILGLNLKESIEIASVLGLSAEADPEPAIARTAAAIRQALQINCVVIHPRRGAAAALEGQTAQFAGPFVQEPKISTGAGDHFNAGFCLAQVLGMSLEESLCVGVSTSGYYVRTAESPSAVELSEFIANLPAPQ